MISYKKIKNIAVVAALTAAMTVSIAGVAAYAETNVTLGDVNGDGKVNILDVTTIQKVEAKLISEPENYLEAADVNSDNVVNIKDASVIQKYLAKIYKELPAEVGVDDTTVNPRTSDLTNPSGANETSETAEPVTGGSENPSSAEDKTSPSETIAPTPGETETPSSASEATEPTTDSEYDEDGYSRTIYRP